MGGGLGGAVGLGGGGSSPSKASVCEQASRAAPRSRQAARIRITPPPSDELGQRPPRRGGIEIDLLRDQSRTAVADVEREQVLPCFNIRSLSPHCRVGDVPSIGRPDQVVDSELGIWVGRGPSY